MGIGGTAHVIHVSYETGHGCKGQHEGYRCLLPTGRTGFSVRDSSAFFMGNGGFLRVAVACLLPNGRATKQYSYPT